MRLYRIADARFAPDSGEGARRYGGRWNSPGRTVIYACTTYAGAMLEKLVHTGRQIPRHQVCLTFDIPDDLTVAELDLKKVPGWKANDGDISRQAGDAWLESARSAVLLVPSVVFDVDRNAMINPAHSEFARVRIISTESVRWDDRLFTAVSREH